MNFKRFRRDADLEDELRVHLEMQAQENADRGMPPGEARRRAHLRLGRTPAIIERIRDQEAIVMLEGWYKDFLFGMRAIRQSPVFCVTAILTLALGIGANTAIFALLYGLLLRSLPVVHPEQLAHIRVVSAAAQFNDAGSFIKYRMIEQFEHEQHSFVGISLWTMTEVTMLDGQGSLRAYQTELVSGNAFSLLGLNPYLGRLISPADDVRGGPPQGWPVVLSYGFWTEHFGADSAIAGKQITVSNTPMTIVGVAPPDFRGVRPGADIKLYLPLHFATPLFNRPIDSPESFFGCSAIGRLKSETSLSEAANEVAFHQKELFSQFIPVKYQHLPFWEKASLNVASARSGLPTYFGHVYSEPLFLMQGLVALVLLLCCVNVGGLMLSKVYARQREFAVRTAIGAARWRLIRQYLTESFIIALAGAALGAVATWYGSPALLGFFRDPMMGAAISVQPDRMVFWITGACAVATTLLFGALPAWRAGRSDPAVLLTSRTTGGSRKQIAGRAFVPIQVALSLILVAFATLLSQSLSRLHSDRTGFDVDHVTIQTARFNLLPQKGDAKLDVYQRMVDRLEQMPGMRAAAVTWQTPMTGVLITSRFEAVTQNPDPPEDPHMAYNAVGPGYFRAMNTHILEGREFQKNERSPNICIVNRAAANFFFPHETAMGRYIRSKDIKDFPDPVSCRIIGIAEDAKFSNVREAPPRTIYFPISTKTVTDAGNLVFLMNSGTRTQAVAGYRQALSEIAPSVPLVIFATLRDQMDAALGSQRLITASSNLFAGLALFLSAIGLYGLLASSVEQRGGEIGVRMALGAQRGMVLRMILKEALGLVAAGVLLGAVALFFAVRFIQNMLFGVSAFDPASLAVTMLLLAIVALAAALPPALRAASVDPMVALRAE
jgi:putative ABC transport system permease protein